MLILAGRPSMGKTALAMNVAFNAALTNEAQRKAGVKEELRTGAVAVFSLEMSAEQLAARLLSQAAEITSDNMRRGALDDEEFNKIVVAVQQINQLPIYIDDTPALPVSTLRTRCRRLKAPTGFVVNRDRLSATFSPPRHLPWRGTGAGSL